MIQVIGEPKSRKRGALSGIRQAIAAWPPSEKRAFAAGLAVAVLVTVWLFVSL